MSSLLLRLTDGLSLTILLGFHIQALLQISLLIASALPTIHSTSLGLLRVSERATRALA